MAKKVYDNKMVDEQKRAYIDILKRINAESFTVDEATNVLVDLLQHFGMDDQAELIRTHNSAAIAKMWACPDTNVWECGGHNALHTLYVEICKKT